MWCKNPPASRKREPMMCMGRTCCRIQVRGTLPDLAWLLCGIISLAVGSCWRLESSELPQSGPSLELAASTCLPLNAVSTQLYLTLSPRQQLFACSIYHISNGAQLQCLYFENSRIATPVFIRMGSVVGVLSVDGLATPAIHQPVPPWG